jgi:hypothetical protein
MISEGSERQLNFLMTADYAADSLQIDVQQPHGVEAMQLVPPPLETKQGADQLTYHTVFRAEQPAGANISVIGSYQKASDALTVSAVPTVNPAPSFDSPAVPGEQPSGMVAGYLLVGVGAAILIFSAAMWYINQRRPQPQPAARYRATAKKRAVSGQSARLPVEEVSRFCHKCGTAYKAQAAFCHHCGTKRR